MEQLISEIEAYAARRRIKPATVLQYAAGLGGLAWERWQAGAECTVSTAEKIRKFMVDNPPSNAAEVPACPATIRDDANNSKDGNK